MSQSQARISYKLIQYSFTGTLSTDCKVDNFCGKSRSACMQSLTSSFSRSSSTDGKAFSFGRSGANLRATKCIHLAIRSRHAYDEAIDGRRRL